MLSREKLFKRKCLAMIKISNHISYQTLDDRLIICDEKNKKYYFLRGQIIEAFDLIRSFGYIGALDRLMAYQCNIGNKKEIQIDFEKLVNFCVQHDIFDVNNKKEVEP